MMIEDFNPEVHYPTLSKWWREWDQPPPPLDWLPRTGVVAGGYAAGFLYTTDSNVCIFDCYIANPESDPRDRDAALDAVTRELVERARELKFKAIVVNTKIDAIKSRAARHGFAYTGEHASFIREL